MSYKKTMRKRPTVESLVMNILNPKDKIALPDRTATTLRNSNKLTVFDDNFEMLDQDLKNRRISEVAKANYNMAYRQHLGYIPSTVPIIPIGGQSPKTTSELMQEIAAQEQELERLKKEEAENAENVQIAIEQSLKRDDLLDLPASVGDVSTLSPGASSAAASSAAVGQSSPFYPIRALKEMVKHPITEGELNEIKSFNFEEKIKKLFPKVIETGFQDIGTSKGTDKLNKDEAIAFFLKYNNEFLPQDKVRIARYLNSPMQDFGPIQNIIMLAYRKFNDKGRAGFEEYRNIPRNEDGTAPKGKAKAKPKAKAISALPTIGES